MKSISAELTEAREILSDRLPGEIRLDDDIKHPAPLLQINIQNATYDVAHRQGIITVAGPPKSSKSSFLQHVVAELATHNGRNYGFRGDKCKVLYVDTEQSHVHLHKAQRRMASFNTYPDSYYLDSCRYVSWMADTVQERKKRLAEITDMHDFNVIVLDGALDFVTNMNDSDEVDSTIKFLMEIANKTNGLVITVVHTDKQGVGLIGHLGQYLRRKSETIITIKRDGREHRLLSFECRNAAIPDLIYSYEKGITSSTE